MLDFYRQIFLGKEHVYDRDNITSFSFTLFRFCFVFSYVYTSFWVLSSL